MASPQLPRHPLRDRFLTRLDEHLRRDLEVPERARLVVAFSGGGDSTAALAALAALAPVRGYRLEAVHINHGLQAAADDWERQARAAAEALAVPFRALHWQGRAAAGDSEEAAARSARYRLLETALAPGDWLVTAHHADDQAETVLLYLARGAGLDGLSGIERRRDLGGARLIRPLLPFDRAALAAFRARCGLAAVSDPSNTDPRFARARARHRLLPCLGESMGETVSPALARSADLLQDARAVLETVVAGRLEGLWQAGPPPALTATGLAALDAAEGRMVLREALRRAGQVPPARDQLERARRLAGRDEASGEVAWAGGGVRRSGNRLILDAGDLAGSGTG